MRIDIDELLKKVTEVHIKKLMKDLGATIGRDEPTYITYNTICHKGHSHKLYYYKESKTFNCYTECGNMSIIDLIKQVKKCNFVTALRELANRVGYTTVHSFTNYKEEKLKNELDEMMELFENEKVERIAPKIPILNSKVLERFDNLYREEWLNDNISTEAMRTFNIKYYSYKDKIVIPHYNYKGELIGIRTRNFDSYELEQGMKYTPLYLQSKMYNHPLHFNFYGIDKNIENIKKRKSVVLVEAEKGVLQAETFYGRENNITLACCGSNISLYQRDFLLDLGIDRVYIGFDKQWKDIRDKEYDRWVKKISKIIKLFSPYIDVFILWDKNDLLDYKDSPYDKGKIIAEKMFETKIKFNGFEEEQEVIERRKPLCKKINTADYIKEQYLLYAEIEKLKKNNLK